MSKSPPGRWTRTRRAVLPVRTPGNHGGAGAGAAGERLARAALPDAEVDFVVGEDFDELRVDAPGEGRVMFDQRADGGDGVVLHIVHEDDGVGVTHGDAGDGECAAATVSGSRDHRSIAIRRASWGHRRAGARVRPCPRAPSPLCRPDRHGAGGAAGRPRSQRRSSGSPPVRPRSQTYLAKQRMALPHISASEPSGLNIRIWNGASRPGSIRITPSPPTPNLRSFRNAARCLRLPGDGGAVRAEAVDHDEVVADAVHFREVHHLSHE